MSSDLDVASLLVPFEGESRIGEDLREDDNPNNAYRKIRDARNAARDGEIREDRGDERRPGEPSPGDWWSDVWSLGQNYLRETAKDLEVVAYMIEASIRLHGFAGLAESIGLTNRLIEEFWGELLPTPDEDGIETTLRPIARLNGDAIVYPLQRVPVTEDTSAGQFVVWQYDQARRLEKTFEKNPEEAQAQVEKGAATIEKLTRAAEETSAEFYQSLFADLQRAQKSVQELNDLFEAKVEEEFQPNLSKFNDGLNEAETVIRLLAGDRLHAAPEEAATESGDSNSAAPKQGTSAANSAGQLVSRDDALTLLEKVAAWFQQHEPQSILPHEIRKVIRRGKMRPEQLFVDLIDDEDARRKLFRDVGIVESEGGDDNS